MLLKHATRLSCYDRRNKQGNESRRGWVIPMEKTNRFPLFHLGDMYLEYQPPLRLDFGLLLDMVRGKELIGGRESRVVMDVRVPFE